ncbi:MAG TPA: hypothetical protein VJR47_05755 [Stellaceae bacterium]|nr:hypothetical protein [Stellaceae bacterium]
MRQDSLSRRCRAAIRLDLEGEWLRTGDGAAVEGLNSIAIAAHDPRTEILLFDLP